MRRTREKLAASFVVTLSAISGSACSREAKIGSVSLENGRCLYNAPGIFACTNVRLTTDGREVSELGMLCNPPRVIAFEVECPPEGGGSLVSVSDRPRGMSDWVRVPARLSAPERFLDESGERYESMCHFMTDGFCSTDMAEPYCTSRGVANLPCSEPEDFEVRGHKMRARRWRVPTFSWRDAMGRCRRVQSQICTLESCEHLEGELVSPDACVGKLD